MDGYALWSYLDSRPDQPRARPGDPRRPGPRRGRRGRGDGVRRLVSPRLLPAAPTTDAWIPERLEYAFATSAPRDGAELHLTADEYFHGHLDWYNLDIDPDGDGLGDVPGAPLPEDVQVEGHTATFLPTPISFDGMPHTRWWTFEDGTTNFGDIDPDTTDINKLLVMEFGLVYANDWFLLPFTVPAGTVARVRGLTRHQRLRRAHLGARRPAAAPTRTGSAGRCSPSPPGATPTSRPT